MQTAKDIDLDFIPVNREGLSSLFVLLECEEKEIPWFREEADLNIDRYDRIAHEVYATLEDDPRYYGTGWQLRGWTREQRAEFLHSHTLTTALGNRLCSQRLEREFHMDQFVRGVFGREFTGQGNPPCPIEAYQPAPTVRIKQLPLAFVEAFLRGMEPRRITFFDTAQPDPETFLNMSIRGTRYRGVNYTSPRGHRRFLWHLYGTNRETARALFVLPYRIVDDYTRRFCIAALGKLVLQYRKLDPLRFAAWVTKAYPQIDPHLVQAIVLPSEGASEGTEEDRCLTGADVICGCGMEVDGGLF